MQKPAKLRKPFVSKIVGHGREAVDQLLANPDNPKIHPETQQQALSGSIDDIGFTRSISVNVRSGEAWPPGQRGVHTMVDGHLRALILARSNVAEVDVEYVDLSPEEEAEALRILDPIAALAAHDREKTAELERRFQGGDERVRALLSSLAEPKAPPMPEPPPTPAGFDQTSLPVASVHPNDYSPSAMTAQEYAKLKRSIQTVGVLNPILVRPAAGGYEIVDGNQRWKACKELGHDTIPVRVRSMADGEARAACLASNALGGRFVGTRMVDVINTIKDDDETGSDFLAAAAGMSRERQDAYKSESSYGVEVDEDGVAQRQYKEYGEADLDPIGERMMLLISLDPPAYERVSAVLSRVSRNWAEALVVVVEAYDDAGG